MRIACPRCDAAYEVPDRVLAAARPLRCARCGHTWAPAAPAAGVADDRASDATLAYGIGAAAVADAAPPTDPPPAATIAEPGPAPARHAGAPPPPVPASPAPSRPDLAALAAWAASLALVGGGLALLWRGRDAVAAAWPPAARLFAALGAPTP